VHLAVTRHSSTQLYSLPSKGDNKGDNILDDGDDNVIEDKFDRKLFNPDMTAQIEKAKQLINDAKKKQEETDERAANPKAEEEETTQTPFFAAKSDTADPDKIKSFLESGEIIADGETMASLSASEPWERRSLSQMFDNESETDYDGNVVEGKKKNTLAERDVGASIYNLRKKMQTEDFLKVFNRKQYLIGDLDWDEKQTTGGGSTPINDTKQDGWKI